MGWTFGSVVEHMPTIHEAFGWILVPHTQEKYRGGVLCGYGNLRTLTSSCVFVCVCVCVCVCVLEYIEYGKLDFLITHNNT